MGTPFLSEIKLISWNFPPKGWAFCNGQILPINQNQALFSLLGTTYGGNGQTTFALPNLQGRIATHTGAFQGGIGHTLGEHGGEATHTLALSEMPTHTHAVAASTTAATKTSAVGNIWAGGGSNNIYTTAANVVSLNPASMSSIGGSQPHENEMPYTVLNFIIALQGIFPSQN